MMDHASKHKTFTQCVLMLAHRLRRWPNIETLWASDCLLFTPGELRYLCYLCSSWSVVVSLCYHCYQGWLLR